MLTNKVKDFTVERGIEIQSQQLKRWKRTLKKKVYDALVEYATETNGKAIDGYGIRRGSDLSSFIANYQPKK